MKDTPDTIDLEEIEKGEEVEEVEEEVENASDKDCMVVLGGAQHFITKHEALIIISNLATQLLM